MLPSWPPIAPGAKAAAQVRILWVGVTFVCDAKCTRIPGIRSDLRKCLQSGFRMCLPMGYSIRGISIRHVRGQAPFPFSSPRISVSGSMARHYVGGCSQPSSAPAPLSRVAFPGQSRRYQLCPAAFAPPFMGCDVPLAEPLGVHTEDCPSPLCPHIIDIHTSVKRKNGLAEHFFRCYVSTHDDGG